MIAFTDGGRYRVTFGIFRVSTTKLA